MTAGCRECPGGAANVHVFVFMCRLRNIRKKMNEIIELEKKVEEGEKLAPEQLQVGPPRFL